MKRGRPQKYTPEEARQRAVAAAQRLCAKRLAAGLCRQCGRLPFVPGRTQCDDCLRAQAARMRARAEKRKAAGACVQCGTIENVVGNQCRPCQDRSNAAAVVRSRRKHQAREATS